MRRTEITPRANWQSEIGRSSGYAIANLEGVPQWRENAYYAITGNELDRLVNAAREVRGIMADVGQNVVVAGLFPLLAIDTDVGNKIAENWNLDVPGLIARLDFAFDGVGDPKLIDYNADTLGNLFETAILQARWADQRFPGVSQFNSIHNALVNRWKALLIGRRDANVLHVTANGAVPDEVLTAGYIGQCATDANYAVTFINTEDLGTFEGNFYDMQDQIITQVYKAYPWDRFQHDTTFPLVDYAKCWWYEPLWKMLLQCNGLLTMAWDTFTEHPNLLPTFSTPGTRGTFVKKPTWSKNSTNVEIVIDNNIVARGAHDDKYLHDGYIFQGLGETANLDGHRPFFSIYVVGDDICGLGIRETTGLMTDRNSPFIPHLLE